MIKVKDLNRINVLLKDFTKEDFKVLLKFNLKYISVWLDDEDEDIFSVESSLCSLNATYNIPIEDFL